MQLADPLHSLLTVLTLLRDAQPATPQRLHAVIFSVLDVVLKLTAARPGLGCAKDVLKTRCAVLKQLDAGCCLRGSRACPGQLDHIGRCRGSSSGSREVVADVFAEDGEVEQHTFLQYPHEGRLRVDRLEVVRPGVAKHTRRIRRHGHVDLQPLLFAQALEVLGHRFPRGDVLRFCQGPVHVVPAARVHHIRSAQFVQPRFLHEGVKRLHACFLGAVGLGAVHVAVNVNEQRLDVLRVLGRA